jgi:hypothetical protein
MPSKHPSPKLHGATLPVTQKALYCVPQKKKGRHVHYEQQKAMQRELNERIPPAAKGDPQNELRHVVNSQRFSGKSFDQSVDFALTVIMKRYPQFTPRILPPRKELVRAAKA